MSDEYTVIIMLVTEFTLNADGTGRMFGFWYFNTDVLPAPKTERDGFLPDLLNGRCCQLQLQGRSEQIVAILRSSANEAAKTIDYSGWHDGITVRLDDVNPPSGKSWGVDVGIRTTDSVETIRNKIQNRRDVVEIFIAPDWQLDEDLSQYFSGT